MIAAAALLACSTTPPAIDYTGKLCGSPSGCPEGYDCQGGVCEPSGADAGPTLTAGSDGGLDAGAIDSGVDAGSDAGLVPDAGGDAGTAMDGGGDGGALDGGLDAGSLRNGGADGGLPSSTVEAIADADWILLSQLSDGAICWYPDKSRIEPYFADYAALGLAHAYALGGQARHLAAAWAWLSWYQAHEDANGYVTVYTVAADGTETSTGTEDSTDAYAGVFLLAAREAYRASGDLATLSSLSAGLSGAVSAIESTQQSDGLTWATPSYQAKYLIDQTEVYAGLVSAEELANALGNSALAARAGSDASRVAAGVQTLWLPDAGLYAFAKNGDGTLAPTSWNVFYPDSIGQMWLLALGGAEAASPVIDAGVAAGLAATFLSTWPTWDAPLDSLGDAGSVNYWPIVGLGLRFAGMASAEAAGEASIREAGLDAGRAWPFTTGVSGELILVEP
ncbi:MAG: glucosidase family protein [Deltaproteobacteria bacterium]